MLQDLQLEQVYLGPFGGDLTCQIVDAQRHLFVVLEVLGVLFRLLASVRRVFLMHLLQLCVVLCLFRLQVELHVLQLLEVLVLYLLPEALLLRLGFLRLPAILFLHCLDHVIELLEMVMMRPFHLFALSGILILKNAYVPSELFLQSLYARVLDSEECLDVNQMVPYSDLVLVLSLIEVLVQHLYECLLGVEFPLVVLRVDVDLVTQLLRLGDTHDLPPIGQELLLVEVHDLVLGLDLRTKDILLHLGQLLQLVELVLRLSDLSDLNVLLRRQSSWTSAATLQCLAQQTHIYLFIECDCCISYASHGILDNIQYIFSSSFVIYNIFCSSHSYTIYCRLNAESLQIRTLSTVVNVFNSYKCCQQL